MKRYAWLGILAAILCFSGSAYAAALTSDIAVGLATPAGGGQWTQTFTWAFNSDQTAMSSVFDFSKCVQPITIAFDADTISDGTAAKYQLYSCASTSSTQTSGCRLAAGGESRSEHSAGGEGLPQYVGFFPATVPASGDVAVITVSCTTDGWIYDIASEAWVAAEAVASSQSSGYGVTNQSVYFNDFMDFHTDAAPSIEPGSDFDIVTGLDWTLVNIGTTTNQPIGVDAEPGGALRLLGDAADTEGQSILLDASAAGGYAFKPAAGREIYVEFRVRTSSNDTHHWFVGLFETIATTIMTGATGDMVGSKEYAGWHFNDDDDTAGIPGMVVAGGDNSEVSTTNLLTAITAQADATWKTYAIKIVGVDAIYYYVDGVMTGSNVAVDDFTAPLYIAAAMANNTGAADTFDIDYVYAAQTR